MNGPASAVVHGTPTDWFAPHGWRVLGTPDGMEWGPVTRTVLEAVHGANPDGVPTAAWFRTRKGRGYGKVDASSHGTPHAANSPAFWAVRRSFMDTYGVAYEGVDAPLPEEAAAATIRPGPTSQPRSRCCAGILRWSAGSRTGWRPSRTACPTRSRV